MKLPIYLDYQATTPVDPEVFKTMAPYFTEIFGNAASRNHEFGWTAESAVEKARAQIAHLLGATDKEIIFTSGATESDNLALLGVAELYREKGNHIITTPIEHKAILDTCHHLESKGFTITYLPVNEYGQVTPAMVRDAITPKTILVSIMAANNEVGSINPLAEIGKVCKEKGVLFHTDAAQAVGKIPLNMEEMGIDLLSLSAHKMYGPKGIGAIYVRRRNPRVRLAAIMHGGGHERGMRSGTLNVPGIVGFGKAAEICERTMAAETAHTLRLRERLWAGIRKELDDVYLNGHATERIPGNLNISFAYVEGESLMMGMKELAVSSGSACTSASLEPSYVLKAIGVGEDLAHTSIRFGLGRFTTEEEIDFAIAKVVKTVKKLRDLSPLYEMAKEGIDLKSVQWTGH
ncbi:MAG TPA: IscS subfamily cysteine desulfurase [Bdellovibrionales bacterium]|nr:MAG: IscS subfamily cysteine desulfurase [Bdellovibrionales bacterium GWB1_52_6]OFZ04880.1 MAG: IscS subfamily cysteine desulfurase [Bdellovibrionales bacterium GWA1_52_35]OFZ42326.1 MAG: IscS subfamily cysteine desulfurase [Bdellovibrionales bacterium GWC1_52_8]HAR43893.1 IscS subfamily cysteine desulfurase [Bdellovibrionales bacterium]HCM38968.1 IscS subfamily cysteine desulfurase [Bdellovibrionales bacterium]